MSSKMVSPGVPRSVEQSSDTTVNEHQPPAGAAMVEGDAKIVESDPKTDKVKGKSLTEGDKDLVKQPDNNLFIVMPILWLLVFLASLDQTIVGTILPTISAHLHGSPTQYQWVGTSYLLGMGATTPIWGRLTDVIGRKPVLQAATLIFLCFSAMCGAAPNMKVLIAGRALQGVGAGALLSVTMMVVADIVPLAKRPMYLGLVTCSFTVSSVVGPLIGGAFASRVTWRWAFYFNLPTAGAAFVLLFFFLKLNRIQRLTFQGFLQTFDFLGLFMLIAAAGLVVVGFSLAADRGFNHPEVYVCVILGLLFLIATIVNCLHTKRTAIFPPRAFGIRTVPLWLLVCLFGSFGFFPTTFLLPQFFQGLRGDSPIAAGIKMIPFIVLTSVNVVIVGVLLSKKDKLLKPIGIAGNALAAIGFGLMYKYFRYGQPLATYEGLQVLVGIGIGMTLQPQMIGMQAAMPLREVGTMTTAMLIVRPAGSAVGLAVQESLFSSRLHSKFSHIAGYGTTFIAPQSGSQAGYDQLQHLPDPLRAEVLTAFADAQADCWLVDCVMFIAAFVAVLFVKEYSLKRTAGGEPTTQGNKSTETQEVKDASEAEKGGDPAEPDTEPAFKPENKV